MQQQHNGGGEDGIDGLLHSGRSDWHHRFGGGQTSSEEWYVYNMNIICCL
jgi:hypothetical protein